MEGRLRIEVEEEFRERMQPISLSKANNAFQEPHMKRLSRKPEAVVPVEKESAKLISCKLTDFPPESLDESSSSAYFPLKDKSVPTIISTSKSHSMESTGNN